MMPDTIPTECTPPPTAAWKRRRSSVVESFDSFRQGRLQHPRILQEEAGRWEAGSKKGKGKQRERAGDGNKGAELKTESRDWKVLLQRDAAERETTAAIYSDAASKP